jgi:toxin ParE1/3/4
MLRYRFHPAAEEELLKAKSYIKSDDFEQGEIFEQAFTNALNWARIQPLIFRCFEGEFRKAKVGKFRYSLVFRLRGDEIQILAVAHMSRKPSYWKDRLQNLE